MAEPEPIRFTGTIVEWPDEGRRIVVEVGPDCHEYPAIGEPVIITRHADAARSGATPDGLREALDAARRFAAADPDVDCTGCTDVEVIESLQEAIDRIRERAALAATPSRETAEGREYATFVSDVELWADVRKFIRWSANVRDDTTEAVAVARALNERIDGADQEAADRIRATLRALASSESSAPAGGLDPERLKEAFITVEAGYIYAHDRTARAYWQRFATTYARLTAAAHADREATRDG